MGLTDSLQPSFLPCIGDATHVCDASLLLPHLSLMDVSSSNILTGKTFALTCDSIRLCNTSCRACLDISSLANMSASESSLGDKATRLAQSGSLKQQTPAEKLMTPVMSDIERNVSHI